MKRMLWYRTRTAIVVLCIVAVLSSTTWSRTASAALVSTEQLTESHESAAARQHVLNFLQREDVHRFLEEHGVDANEASSRVVALSDSEVQELAAHVDALPAGEGSVGAVIGVIALILLILLVTDLLGWTNVYTFI